MLINADFSQRVVIRYRLRNFALSHSRRCAVEGPAFSDSEQGPEPGRIHINQLQFCIRPG